MAYLSEEFTQWLEKNAATIDQESGGPADELLEKIAAEGVFGLGVDEALGGRGGDAPGGGGGPGRGVYRREAPGLRQPHRPGRQQCVRRPEAAAVHCPGRGQQAEGVSV